MRKILSIFGPAAVVTGLLFVALLTIFGAPPSVAQQGATTIQPIRCTWTNRTVLTSGTTTVAAANPTRNYLLIQNPSTAALQGIATAESIFIDLSAAASTTNGLEVPAGASFVMEGTTVSTQAVTAIATTTSHRIIAKEC